LVLGILGAVGLVTLLLAKRLVSSEFSLHEALSEEVPMPVSDPPAKAGDPATLKLDPSTGKPVLAPQLVSSSSRVIALFGMSVMLVLYTAMGLVLVWGYASTGRLPDKTAGDGIYNFFYIGLVVFAPYFANQTAAAIKSFAPSK
jgi:hypothetical protein